MSHRIQIMIGDNLIGEVIGSFAYVDNVWFKWCELRYSRNEDLGCCSISLVSTKRFWTRNDSPKSE